MSFKQGNYQKAIDLFSQLVVDPEISSNNWLNARVGQARCLQEQGKLDEAEKILPSYPDNEALHALSIAHLQRYTDEVCESSDARGVANIHFEQAEKLARQALDIKKNAKF